MPPGREFLQVPGPTNIPDRVLNAMHRPAMDFSAPEFGALALSVFEDLKPVFGTDGEVFLYASSGHGGWEASLVNLMEAGERVLLPQTGMFSDKWRETAEGLGFEVVTIPTDYRSPIDPDRVERALRADPAHRIKAVLAVHVETNTGVLSDLRAIRQAIDAAGHPALLIADAIASLCTTPLPMAQWGVDVTIAASQKGLMSPPGIALVAASPRALELSEAVATPREYWSWQRRRKAEIYRKFCGTAPEHLVFGLREALNMLAEEGLENVLVRHARLAGAVRAAVGRWCDGGPLEFNARDPACRAEALTVILSPDAFDMESVRTIARDRFGVALGGGLGRNVLRIGHMGDLNEPTILGALAGLQAALKVAGVPCGAGALDAAVDWLVGDRRADGRRADGRTHRRPEAAAAA